MLLKDALAVYEIKKEGTKKDVIDFLRGLKLLPETESSQDKNSRAAYRKKILLVDDDGKARQTLRDCVGEQFLLLDSGEIPEAMKIMAQYPDIAYIFINLQLPDKNGIKLLKTIRSLKMMEWANLIAISNVSSPELIEGLKKLNVTVLLQKPLDPSQLKTYLKIKS
ncbi:MAG: response regulator [Oligoflexales bacterium]|nr:response regulator [Oligoflexales bacterium]